MEEFTYAGASESYTYDNDGLLTAAGSFTIPRNATTGFPTSVSDGTFTITPTFNGYGELDGVGYAIGASDAFEWDVVRYNTGAIQSKVETLGATTDTYAYTYDELGQLRTVTKNSSLVEEYEYDANGWRTYEMNAQRGITGRAFAYSDEDHLASVTDSGGVTTYSYDQDGFLVSKNDTANSETTLYDYSSRGELRSVTLPDATLIEYVHDPLGRRIAKKVNSVVTEKYLWSEETELLALYDGNDSLVARFEYADSSLPFKMVQGGATYYLACDQVGSLRAVIDSTGTIVHQIAYDSWGNILSETNSGLVIPFGFAGGLHDRDTNLVRFGFRDYDPDTGRWKAKDPIMFAGGDMNLYRYCSNDPVSLIDPLGLGEKLPESAIEALSPYFGSWVDLNNVTIEEGIPWWIDMFAQIEVAAVTVDHTIYFAPGEYDPNSPSGLAQIGHELTHVVQQQIDGGFVKFGLPYLAEWFGWWCVSPDGQTAYESIGAERHARAREEEIRRELEQKAKTEKARRETKSRQTGVNNPPKGK